jgi:hypothetical protein
VGLEPLLEEASQRHHHVVIRVYIDYPNQEYALPEYLQEYVSCEPYTEHGGGCSPDYNHPLLQEAIRALISEMGARYNTDHRIAFVQAGLLGFWGEWHTWPRSELFASASFQSDVLQAYIESFPNKFVQLRNPTLENVGMDMGFHDDSFAYSTLGDEEWFFYPTLARVGGESRWTVVPIGGELRPELQAGIFQESYEISTYAQDIMQCIEQVHPTYLLNYWAFNGAGAGYVGETRTQAEEASMTMGYQFELQAAELTLSLLQGSKVKSNMAVHITQIGVAPFYYPLYLSIRSEYQNSGFSSSVDLSQLLPGESIQVDFDMGMMETSAFQERFLIELNGDILLPEQRILLPTRTESTEPEEITSLLWKTECVADELSIPLGHTILLGANVEYCRCDVDGMLRFLDGRLCQEE